MLAYVDPNQFGLPVQVLTAWLAAAGGVILSMLALGWQYVCAGVAVVARLITRHWWLMVVAGTGVLLFLAGYWLGTSEPRLSETSATASASSGSSGVWSMEQSRDDRRLVLLGMDGLDPQILEALMEAGELPMFSKIKDMGQYRSLQTTRPPESPVVWSSLATGLSPGGHGLFDFIHREPKKYSLDLSLNKRKASGGYTNPRSGEPFWHHLASQGVEASALFAPCSFPPSEGSAQVLAGMGTPDLQGTLGRYILISSDPTWAEKDLNAELIGVAHDQQQMHVELPGPRFGNAKPKTASLTLERHESDGLTIRAGGNAETLTPGQWSGWFRLTFKRPMGSDISGLCRFYLKALSPDLTLYCSPVQFDPADPAFPISRPEHWASALAKSHGSFATLGLPIDTKALEDGALDAEGFERLAHDVAEEHQALLLERLAHQPEGLIFGYFGAPDPIQHMFWRDFLKQKVSQQGVEAIPGPIVRIYQKMDRVLASVWEELDEGKQGDVVVISDHGFADFRRAVDINRLLEKLGHLSTKSPAPEDASLFKAIDWEETQAYACGFSSIFVNLRGREGSGVVKVEERDQLLNELREALLAYQDPQTEDHPFKTVARARDVYQGPHVEEGPDLVIGMREGYRASWETALGGLGDEVVKDNERQWAGDHIVDPGEVPGVCLTNLSDQRQPVPEHIQGVGHFVLNQFEE